MEKNKRMLAVFALVIFASSLWLLNYGSLSLLENSCQQLWVNAPSTVELEKEFEFHVQAWDQYERLSANYDGEVEFKLLSYDLNTPNIEKFKSSADLPKDYKFKGMIIEQGLIPGYKLRTLFGLDCGQHTFKATIQDLGIHYIIVEDDQGNVAYSNPIRVYEKKPPLSLYWGDIHGHSALCDGSGYMEEMYRFAKEVAYLDFASVSTHDDWTDYYGSAPEFGATWEIDKAATNRWNKDDEFVTLVCYEWTSQFHSYGHMNVYYKGDDGPMFSSSYNEYVSQDKLWDALREWKSKSGSDVITIPHHTGHEGGHMYYDWSYYDKEFVPLVEIYSAHGSSEKMNGPKTIKPGENKNHGYHVQDALAMGYKIGIMSSSDTHDGRLGHPILHTEANNRFQYPYTMIGLAGGGFRFGEDYEGGLTGVYSESLTRKDIFNALKARSCYASTHVKRPIIDFSINGISIGVDDSTVRVPTATSPRNINIFTAIDAGQEKNYIKSIKLIKNNNVFQIIEPDDKLIINYTYADTEEVEGMDYEYGIDTDEGYKITETAKIPLKDYSEDDPPSTKGIDVYYVRITQEKGEMAWIGPIWVEVSD